jgi:hypothetical protein
MLKIYSWNDDKGPHSVCAECLQASGLAAVCDIHIEDCEQQAICELCERNDQGEAQGEKAG